MQAIPLIIAAVGTAATISAENRQESQRRDVLNRQLERDDKSSEKATQMVEQQGQNFGAQNRLNGLEGQEQKTYDQSQADLAGAGGAGIAAAGDNSNVSSDFLQTKAARAIDESTRLSSIARAAAKARAPGQLQQDDSLGMAGLAGNLQNLWGTTRNMGGATNLDAQGVKMPMYGQLGRVASAVGGAMASSGAYGQGATSGAVPPNPYASGIRF